MSIQILIKKKFNLKILRHKTEEFEPVWFNFENLNQFGSNSKEQPIYVYHFGNIKNIGPINE